MSTALASVPAVLDPTEARRQRGLSIAAMCRVVQKKDGLWTVPAQSGGGQYWVKMDADHPTCTCKDYETRQQKCKHVFAVEYVLQRESNPDGSETVTESVTFTRQTTTLRPTYRQDWRAYNRAQTNEKHKFQVLLADLCRDIPEPHQEKGRPRLSLRDMTFCVAYKVFSTVSGRRFVSDLMDAQGKGYIAKVPHFNSLSNYLESPALAPVLRRLIERSSLPLRSVEVDFAVDSTGFTSCRFVRWFDHKYGQPKQEHDWVKVHLVCGVKSNIVVAVEIGDRHAADSPYFKPLFEATRRNFGIRDVSADAAYLSYENVDAVGAAGGTPYILPKSNTTAAGGGLFEKMFHLYCLNRNEFLSHYHKRSNVESTNMMIKAKFGDAIRSKTDTAMTNEALCKVLCHNICCVIQSHYELGIEPMFWKDEPIPSSATIEAAVSDEIDELAWM